MPPLTAVTTPSSVPYRFGSGTACLRMMRHSGTVGPATPWTMRPANSSATEPSTPDSAEITQPTAVRTIIQVSSRRRPIMSPRRGRKRAKSAAAVKKAVCDVAMTVPVVLSSFSMVTSAGLSMEALSWKAKQATRRAVMTAPTDFFAAAPEALASAVAGLMRRPPSGSGRSRRPRGPRTRGRPGAWRPWCGSPREPVPESPRPSCRWSASR